MQLFNRICFVAALVLAGAPLFATTTGCAKKAEPVEVKENFQLNIGAVSLARRDTGFVEEQDQLRYVLRVTNGLKGPITIDKVEFTYGIGEREIGTGAESPKTVVAVGASERVFLQGNFEWRQTSDMPEGLAFVKGTVYWTGPHNPRTTTFEFSKEYTVSE